MIILNDLFSSVDGSKDAAKAIDDATLSSDTIISSNAANAAKYLVELQNGSISKAEYQDLMLDLQDKLLAVQAVDSLKEKIELEQSFNTLVEIAASLPIP